MRKLMIVAGALAIVALSAFFSLQLLWPAPPAINRPPLAAVPPLEPITRTSTVVAPAAISLAAIQKTLESTAPRNLAGNRSGATRELPIDMTVGWTIDRGPLSITGHSDGLTVSTPLNGSLRANGALGAITGAGGQIGGAIGNVIGNLGGNVGRQVQDLAGKAFDQRAEVHGNVSVISRPTILPTWRMAPNLTAQVTINDVSIPLAGLRLSVANEVKPLVDRSVREQVAQFEARVREDRTLEQTMRTEWARLCKSYSLGAVGSGAPNLWIEIKPTKAFAAQPRIDATAVNLLIGVEAQTRIVPTATHPDCPFPAQLEIVPQLTPDRVNIGVPIDIPFTDVNRLLHAQLRGKTFPEDNSGVVSVTIRHVELAASGDQLLISLVVTARQSSFIGFGAEATVNVWGKPLLDRENQILRLTDIELDVSSDAAFGLLGAAARAAAPYLKPLLADKAVVDLKPFAADARKKIEAVLADFQKTQTGVRIDTKVNALRLVGIAFDARTLRVIAEADGTVNVAVTALSMP
jgi:hypothetical protein